MSMTKKLVGRVYDLSGAITRYPCTCMFLLLGTIVNTVSIYREVEYEKQLLTCAVGAIFCAVIQMIYERYFIKQKIRIFMYLAGFVLILCYYYLLLAAPELSLEMRIRTGAALLALFFAYILVPSIKSRVSFNESFMIMFKSFFVSVFYAGVLYGGISLILSAIQNLIYPIGSKFYGYSATWVFAMFTPLFFISQIPVYPGRKEQVAEDGSGQAEKIKKAAGCSRFLEILISYIIIPLAEIFTLILIIYIARNVRGEFWTNNLLEPMLVSYAVAIILISILSSRLDNKFCSFFRTIFPKVMIPIVLFQIASSILSILATGFTHTGYFVLLFGIFAVTAGVVLSLGKVEKNGIVAGLLIGFLIFSIIPPVDAFTISKLSQQNVLEQVLVKNGMLKGNKISKVSTISNDDKYQIISAVQYLERMKYTEKISWMPKDFDVYEDFYNTFGFYEYDAVIDKNRSVTVFLGEQEAIQLTDFEYMAHTYINSNETMKPLICAITHDGIQYTLEKRKIKDNFELVLSDENKNELIVFDTKEIFDRYQSYAVEDKELTQEEATFYGENEKIGMSVVVQESSLYYSDTDMTYFSNFYIFLNFK
ncbi:MAG TPA: DUF4153 domain-containing protein [Lachnospiraceae bacterium]|nr:DUF4153 domain-containing protein [Lachnospiraceae bacterium]